jgi:putative MATE family efflux protein
LEKALHTLFDVGRLIPDDKVRGKIPENREIYSAIMRIAWPSVLERVTMSMIGFIDTILVSALGPAAIAAVGLVNQPRMLMMAIFLALNIGVTAIVARRKGEGRQADANRTLRNAMIVAVLFSGVVAALGLSVSTPLMRLAGAMDDTIADSRTYFEITTWFLPINALTVCICAAQRGVGNTRVTLYVNLLSNLVDLLFSYLLIFGRLGLPRLGVAGAAYGTGIGFVVGLALSLTTVFGKHRDIGFFQLSLKDDWRLDLQTIREISKVGGSAMLEQGALRLGFFAYARIVAGLGTAVFAAHQICQQFLNLSFTFGDGIAIAGTSLVGQSLGRKRPDMAKLYGLASQRIAMAVALVLGSVIAIFRHQLVGLFTDEPYVAGLAGSVMVLVAIFQPFQTSSVVISGALRGAGDTTFVAAVMMVCVAIIRPLLSLLAIYILSTVLGLTEIALIGAWLASIVDMIIRLTCVYRRFSGEKWYDIKV